MSKIAPLNPIWPLLVGIALAVVAFLLFGCCSGGNVPYPCLPGTRDWNNNNIFGNVSESSSARAR